MKLSTVITMAAAVLLISAPAAAQYDITIGKGASNSGSWSGGDPDVWTGSGTFDYAHKVNVEEIKTRLNAGTSVIIYSPNGSITDSAGVSIAKTSGGDATLTFRAVGYLTFSANDTIMSTSGKLNIIFNGDYDNTMDGYITMQSGTGRYFHSNNGDIVIGGGSDPLNNPIFGPSYQYPLYISETKFYAGTGNISVRAQSHPTAVTDGVQFYTNSVMQTTSGNITIVGTGGSKATGFGSAGFGMRMGSNPVIQTTDGAISITATGGNAPEGNGGYGFLFGQGASITASGSGSITIVGTGGSSYYNGGYGVNMSGQSVTDPYISTVDGDITITATSGARVSGGTGQSYYGFRSIEASITASGTGDIIINATGGSGAQNNYGLYLDNTPVQTNSGSITATGIGGAGTAGGSGGINLYSFGGPSSGLISTSGTITVTGTAANGGVGVYLQGDNTRIESSGNVTVTADTIGSGFTGNGIGTAFGADIRTTGTGNLTLNAIASSIGTGAKGIVLGGGGQTRVETQEGNLTVTAVGGGNSGGNNYGIDITNSDVFYSTKGDVVISAVAGAGGGAGINFSGTGYFEADSGKLIVTATGVGQYGYGILKGNAGYTAYFVNLGNDSTIITMNGATTYSGLYNFGPFQFGDAMHSGPMVISASTVSGTDAIDLGFTGYQATIRGTGHLTLRGATAATTMGLAGGTGTFNISADEMNAIQPGFHKVTFGRSDGTGAITINAYTSADSMELLTGSGAININGTLSVGSNSLDITSNGTVTQNTGAALTAGTVTVSGSGTFALHPTVSNLVLNTSTLTLNGSTQVNDTLFLNSAAVTNSGNTVTLGSSTANTGVLVRTTGTVNGGSMKRWFDAAAVNDVLFPLTVGSDARTAKLSFTSAPSTGGTVTASFSSSAAGSNGFPVTDGAATLGYSNALGFWSATAGDGLAGGTYDMTFDVTGTTFNNLSKLHVIKRVNSGSAWLAEGTHTTATSESGGITRAYRSGLTSFSDFAFGMETGVPTTFAYVSGTNQTAAVNTALTNPFTVLVTDADGDPVPGENVAFAVVDSPYASAGHMMSSAVAVTNSSGLAVSTLTTGNTAGNYRVTASSGSLSGSPVTFHAHVFSQTAGSAISFDGSDDILTASGLPGLANNFTVEFWIKPTAPSSSILTKGDNSTNEYSVGLDGSYHINFNKQGLATMATSATALVANEWSHVAMTYSTESGATIYINGNLDANASSIGPIGSSSQPLTIGGYPGPIAPFTGSLDELKIWSTVRSASEIQSALHTPFTSLTAGLIAYWQFSEGSGSSGARDVVNGTNAVLTNMNVNSAWVTSGIPFGAGTTYTSAAFTSGTATLGNLSLTTTEAFDNAVDLQSRTFSIAPNTVPSGTVLSNTYWSVEAFGTPGTFAANLTFTVPSSFTGSNTKFMSQYKLYRRSFGGDGSWTQLSASANSATATTVTFNGISQVGQYALATTTVAADSTPRYAVRLDGTNDNVEIPDNPALRFTNNFTVSAWVKLDSMPNVTDAFYILSKGYYPAGGYSVRINSQGALLYTSFTVLDYSSPEGLITAGTWHHVAVSVGSDNGASFYVNGVYAGTVPAASPAVTTADVLYIGRYTDYNTVNKYSHGTIDELRIWNSALDSVTIRENMHRIVNSNTAGLVAQWQFVEASGTTAADPVGGYVGTLSNFDFTPTSGWVASTIPAGKATSTSSANFTTGTANLGTVSLTTSEDFDNAVQLTGTSIDNAPNIQPTGSEETLSDRYWVVNAFGDGGTYSADLTFTVPSSFGGQPASTYSLYTRSSTADNAWTLAVNGAASATSTTVTFNGITSFSQFAIGKESSLPFDSIPGYALQFNGSDSYVDGGNPAAVQLNTGTVEAWVKIPSAGAGSGYRGIVVKKFQYGLFLKDNRLLAFDWQYGNWYGSNDAGDHYTDVYLNDDQWHHIALVFTGGPSSSGLVTIYVDGVNTNAYSYYDNNVYNAYYGGNTGNSLLIGHGVPFSGGGVMNGQIEEVKIWNTVRTQEQIRDDMHRTQYGFPSGLVANWQLNQGTGTTATDIVTGSNGTLVNGPSWTASTAPLGKGTTTSASSFSTGTASLGQVSVTTTDGFDNPVYLTSTAITSAPNALPAGYANIVGGRYFVVHTFTAPGTFSTNVTINFGAGVIDSRADAYPGGVRLYTRASNSDGAWTLVGGAASVVSSTGIVTWNGITSFSQLAVVHEESALPVELVSFTATAQRLNAELKWSTATETNNLGFEVERRMMGNGTMTTDRWSKAGFVEGNGTSNISHEYIFVDNNLRAGKYSYRLKQVDRDGNFGYSGEIEVMVGNVPKVFALEQNYPNPFNPSTTIGFTLLESGPVTLKIYDAIGREVAILVNEPLETGIIHLRQFDAHSLASGVYYARLVSGGKAQVRKLLLMK